MNSQQFLTDLKKEYFQRKLIALCLSWASYFLILGSVYLRYNTYKTADIFMVVFGLVGVFLLIRKIKTILNYPESNFVKHLNQTQPALQESAHLLLLPPSNLNVLEQIQLNRITPILTNLDLNKAVSISYRPAWFTFATGLFLAVILHFLPPKFISSSNQKHAETPFPASALKAIQNSIPEIKGVTITIIPPVYTRLPKYPEKQLDFKIPAGAQITWKIEVTGEVTRLHLSLASNQKIEFKKMKGILNTYTLTYKPVRNFLYTLDLNKKKSELHAVEVLPDQVPVITVQKPKPFKEIAFGERQELNLVATLTDDYGLQKASLVATIAKGSGESVTFKEAQYPFFLPRSGKLKHHQVTKNIALHTLGMSYGDELYYYVQAWDNNRGYARSETYFLQIEDTTVVSDGGGLALGVSVVPAYFRSQRQLIIDTEKLLKEKNTLTPNLFGEKSNNLGAEQKLLRLRYGKFLGEESETTIGANAEENHSANDGHDHGKEETEDKNSATTLLDPFIHKHDTEEDATYFEPAVKLQLKAALAFMWEAELQLRLGKPREALPFEYKALRQLKEVQQKSRAYVRKMGFTPPTIEESEKRLSGDLTKIKAPTQVTLKEEKVKYAAIRQALPWVMHQKKGPVKGKPMIAVLKQAGQELAAASLSQPGAYLVGLRDLRKLISQVQQGSITCTSCLTSVTMAFERILPKPGPAPLAPNVSRHKLAEGYFQQLN